MKRLIYIPTMLLLAVSLLLVSTENAYAQGITLSPQSGVGSVIIQGSDFMPLSSIEILWDGNPVPTVPSPIVTGPSDDTPFQGTFAAMITIPTNAIPGSHTITVNGTAPNETEVSLDATFELLSIVGPAGPEGSDGNRGPRGLSGSTGPSGSTGTSGKQGPAGEPGTIGPPGSAGPAGPAGPPGEQGPPSEPAPTGGIIAAIVLAIIAIGLTVFGWLKKLVAG